MLVKNNKEFPIVYSKKVDSGSYRNVVLQPGWNVVVDALFEEIEKTSLISAYLLDESLETKKGNLPTGAALTKLLAQTFSIDELRKMQDLEVALKEPRDQVKLALDRRIEDIEKHLSGEHLKKDKTIWQ